MPRRLTIINRQWRISSVRRKIYPSGWATRWREVIDPDEAVAAYQEAVTQAPNLCAGRHMRMGQLLARRGKVNEAENALLRAHANSNPDLAEAQAADGARSAARARKFFRRPKNTFAPPFRTETGAAIGAAWKLIRIAALEAGPPKRGLAEHAEKHGRPTAR